ncbi:hypothetical protein ERJ75_001203900 [Trypanosoma vivax]|uniref:Uncharacterized protein n=1 Tax=Trypanosoma vivax (strain Y486) TaxID=1055687 RepID=F9WPC4_TRYVY|nr:hypothetical protein ERJ75_001203900 [Trypanosoma vivax]CCD19401.1 hypothetical protein, conserved in T. vivax [Trypanosoma vivax Y486]|eukprot:CCD19401.1 hypothetical protein, conserved in T. vivax [Trypanosoma vivax Y486]
MFSKCFYLLLLFSVLRCDATQVTARCSYGSHLSNELKCATKDVLFGWMSVVNKPALRAEAMKKNASEVTRRAHDVQGRAEVAIVEYKKVRALLNSVDNSKAEIRLIDEAIADANGSIVEAKESEMKAANAIKAAEQSVATSKDCFDAVMRVAHFVWGASADGVWNYTSVKEKLDRYGKNCEKEYNISKKLSDYAENMENMNLTEWKDKALQLLQETYDNLMMSGCRYHGIITNNNEKLQIVEKAVKGAVEYLEVAVQSFKLSHIAMEKAINKLENASRKVSEANNSMLASANGEVFCEIVGHYSKNEENLKVLETNVTDAKQRAADVATSSAQVRVEVTVSNEVVKDVAGWFQRGSSTFPHKFLSTNNLDSAAKASTTVNQIQEEVKTQRKSLMRVQTQLANMSGAAGTNGGKVTFEACNEAVSIILKNKSSEAIRRIAGFNMTLLSVLNKTLQEIGSTAGVIERNLSGVIRRVQEAKSSAQNVSLLAKRATENVREAIMEVLSGGVAELCAVLSKLRALHNEAGAFSVHAAHAQANISEWLLRVGDAAGESDGFDDLSGSVEGAFATAGKRLEVLKRVLHRADEQRGKVVGELAASVAVKESDEHGPQINKTLHDVFANVASMEAKTFSKDVCNASLMTQSLKLLSNMTDHTAVMNSLQVVAQLNRLTESMKERVKMLHNLMRMAAESSAQADAALEEAIRMARERSGKPQCPALYRQLLGALGLHW